MPAPKPNDTPASPLLKFEKREKKAGRPARLEIPAMPVFPITEEEQALFRFFIEAYNVEYPDLTATDQLTLHLAAAEYIKTLRVNQEEFETGKVLSQARQHPAIQLRAFLDSLSVTRKQRKPADKDAEEAKEAREWLLGISKEKGTA